MNPLQRLYQTKLALLATLATVAGVALLFFAHWVDRTGPAWLQAWPLTDVGSALFTTGLIAVFFEYVDNEDAEARATQRLDAAITRKASTIRDAVIDGFAFNADDLARVASPATLDQIARNTLALQLGDRQLAADVYTDLREQVIRAGERWYDLSLSVTLSPWDRGPARSPDALFVATVRREYRVTPTSSTMRFTCVSDLEEYRELLQDPSSTFAWYFRPVAGMTAASDDAFELVQFTVDGKPRSIRRSTRATGQSYSVNLGRPAEAGAKEVTISYTYRVLAQQSGHLIWLDIPKPTKGLKIDFRYGGCGIRYVNVVNFIASAQPTRITESPASVPTPSIEVSFDGWVFPKSGVAFVWVLEKEEAKHG